MSEERLRRIKDFDKFYDDCETIFKNLRDNDKRGVFFQNEYMLCICPGSRAGGTDKRIVEIFWGARLYEYQTQGTKWRGLKEQGATLLFYRNDTGHITISLFPSYTEFREPIESQIMLYRWKDPKALNNHKFIQSLWDDFMAYMEFTSLDGKPSYYQRLKISYFRNFKHLVISKKSHPTRFGETIKKIIIWSVTVGFSGVFIYIFTLLTLPKNTETIFQLKEINNNLDKVSKQLEYNSSFLNKTEKSTIAIDSINTAVKRILQNIEN